MIADERVVEIEALAATHSVLHWPAILDIIARMRAAEAALAETTRERNAWLDAYNDQKRQLRVMGEALRFIQSSMADDLTPLEKDRIRAALTSASTP